MRKLLILLTTVVFLNNCFAQHNHHDLDIQFDIANSSINVIDSINLTDQQFNSFLLNSNLEIYDSSLPVDSIKTSGNYTKYKIKSPIHSSCFVIKYKGKIDHNKDAYYNLKEHQSFQGTDGIIFAEGIYLSGTTYWVPDFIGCELKTFSIKTQLPSDWQLISQAESKYNKHNEGTNEISVSTKLPTNQIYLIGNKYERYTQNINNINISIYLLKADEALAQKYLKVSSQYLEMYGKLIGKFPYPKFDVVENFWETGYGMPSFSLLGKKVMRFPWILASSYPHEMLHNYWGNGVYVNYKEGNWCEGLTSYMADYLMKELKNEGANYRMKQLMDFTDYVNPENDFPVSEFTSKTDNCSQAIGYGKVLMINHMLRQKYGTKTFLEAYQHFYNQYKFKLASFSDIQHSFEHVTSDNLGDFFQQWIYEKGAPKLELANVQVFNKTNSFTLSFDINQTEVSNAFDIMVPIYIYLKGNNQVACKTVNLKQLSEKFTLEFNEEPIHIEIDPYFDVMRLLSQKEVPPSLSKLLGIKQWTIILPKSSKTYEAYKKFAKDWSSMYARRGKKINIIDDSEVNELSKLKGVWLLGSDNKFADRYQINQLYNTSLSSDIIENIENTLNTETTVFTVQDSITNQAIGFINTNHPESLNLLKMKLMHYGKFSYVGFSGKKLKNTLKGNFPVLQSPLKYTISHKQPIDLSPYQLPKPDFFLK